MSDARGRADTRVKKMNLSKANYQSCWAACSCTIVAHDARIFPVGLLKADFYPQHFA